MCDTIWSNFTSMCCKYLPNNVWRSRLQTSKVSVSNSNIKFPIGKPIFVVNLPLKLSRATIANDDTGSLKSLHTLFDTHLDHMLAKFEPNRLVRNVQNFDLFDKNQVFKTIFDKTLTPFCKTFLWLKQLLLMVDY